MNNMYDSTMPSRIPSGVLYVAVYKNGRYMANPTQVARQHPNARIFWIDVLGTAPTECGIADVEAEDMQPSDIPGWVETRLNAHPASLCRVYCNLSTWPAVKTEVAKLTPGQRTHVRYWIADPTGTAPTWAIGLYAEHAPNSGATCLVGSAPADAILTRTGSGVWSLNWPGSSVSVSIG